MTTNLMTGTDTDTVLHVAHRDVASQPLTLGEAVRRRRTELGWNQHDVALRTGLSPWDAKQIERGLLTPSHAIRLALESSLELTMGALDSLPIGGDGLAPTIGLGRIEKVAEAPARRAQAVARLRPFVIVVESNGAQRLAADVNERLAVIEAAGDDGDGRFQRPYLEGITYLVTTGEYIAAVLQYQSVVDLFEGGRDADTARPGD